MLVPIILSGGAGTRLWPLSRELYPKQLLPLIGRYTMLQETALRLAGIPGAAAIFCLLSFVFLSERQQLGFTSLGGYLSSAVSNISEISHTLFTSLLLPFEVTSILILVAILGAVVLARKEL